VSDALGLLGGLGAAGQLAGGLRVQKFEKMFAVTQEGRATETQIAKATEALKGAQTLAKGVAIANEVINYGGLLWGNVEFIDKMMSINAQESSGAMTHAAARRARASAISSAVQNNALFVAGNVMKAKVAATEKKPATSREKAPQEKPITEREKVAGQEAPAERPVERPGVPKTGPLPISERQATHAELKAALPTDLQRMLVVDESLHGDTVKAEYKLDPKTGLISEIRLRCSPDARPNSVKLHTETLRTMQKYQGFSGRVRQAISWVGDLIGFETLNPQKNPTSFEAVLEIRKLPKLIEAQMMQMKNMEANALELAQAELDHLEVQLDKHLRTLELGGAGEAAGYVAAKGLSKAKQKKYADLRAKLRQHEAGTPEHKTIRREMYELIGGDLPLATWEKIYASNVEQANKANATVKAEHQRLGWGKPEQTIELGKGEVRRLDIADTDPKVRRGVEVKAYETGIIYASEDIVSEVQRDAKLVRRGWDITWVLIDTQPSGPLLSLLLNAGIPVEIRTKSASGPSKLVGRHLPAAKPGKKAAVSTGEAPVKSPPKPEPKVKPADVGSSSLTAAEKKLTAEELRQKQILELFEERQTAAHDVVEKEREGDSSTSRTRKQAGVSVEEDHHIATRYLEENRKIFEAAGTHVDAYLNLIKKFPEHGELRGWYDWNNRSYKYNMRGHHPEYNRWVTKILTDATPPGLAPDQALKRILKVNQKLETIIRQYPEVLSHGPGILPPHLRNPTF
jgi:hypothetical protein